MELILEIDCLPLPHREDLIYSTNATSAGTRVEFSCDEDNTLLGNSEIQCQASGIWNGGLPRCERMLTMFINKRNVIAYLISENNY